MQRIIAAFVTALAVVALPHYAAAQDGKRPDGPRAEARPERPNPEAMFNRLDANHDGVITQNEIPEGMPERLKHLLLQADKNHDGKITKAELIAAVNARHAGPPPIGPGPLAKGPCPLAKGPCPLAKDPGPQPNAT